MTEAEFRNQFYRAIPILDARSYPGIVSDKIGEIRAPTDDKIRQIFYDLSYPGEVDYTKNSITSIASRKAFPNAESITETDFYLDLFLSARDINPSFEIDGRVFVPTKRSLSSGNSQMIKLVSYANVDGTDVYTVFHVYGSKSSGTLWRYCGYDGRTAGNVFGRFYKGNDYVVNTTIDHRLQVELNRVYNALPYLDMMDFYVAGLISHAVDGAIIGPIRLANSNCGIYNRLTDPLKTEEMMESYIYGDGRFVDDSVFFPMKIFKSGHTFGLSEPTLDKLRELVEQNSNEIGKQIRNLRGTPDSRIKRQKMQRLVHFAELNYDRIHPYEEKLRSAVTGATGVSEAERVYALFKEYIGAVYSVYSNYMKDNFVITDFGKRIIPTLNSTFSVGEGRGKYEGNVVQTFQVNIRNKHNGQGYVVTAMKYFITKPNGERNGPYAIVTSIAPSVLNITRFGVPSRIVSCGLYVYKMFEYIHQVLPVGRDGTPRDRLAAGMDLARTRAVGGSTYVFIGDLMTGIWPIASVHIEAARLEAETARDRHREEEEAAVLRLEENVRRKEEAERRREEAAAVLRLEENARRKEEAERRRKADRPPRHAVDPPLPPAEILARPPPHLMRQQHEERALREERLRQLQKARRVTPAPALPPATGYARPPPHIMRQRHAERALREAERRPTRKRE